MSAKYWLNPPRGGGLRWVEQTINNTAYYKWKTTNTDLAHGLLVRQRGHYAPALVAKHEP